MNEPTEKMVRKQILVPPSTVKRLEHLAALCGTSASEIVRQAINAYDENDMDAKAATELMELVSSRLKQAIVATQQAQRTVHEALRQTDPQST